LAWDFVVGMAEMTEDMKMELLKAALLLLIIFLPLSVSLFYNKKLAKENRDSNAKVIEAIRAVQTPREG
jgi:hypothetical protein